MKHEKDQFNKISNVIMQLDNNQDPYPICVEIHPTDKCNHKCDYCFHGGYGFDSNRKKETLSIKYYSALFSEIKDLEIQFLSISGGGEPFLDKRTLEIIKLGNNLGLETRIVTNGNLLTQKIKEELMRSREIRFSIDAINPDTYSSIRHVPKFMLSQTLDNIRNLIAMKNENRSTLNIGTTFLINDKNYGEVTDFCKYMLNSGLDSVIIKHDIYATKIVSSEKLNKIKDKILKINDSRIEFREKINPLVRGIKCYIPYFKIAINPYGEIFSCCLGSQPIEKNGYLLGNLHNETLQEIWMKSKPIRQRMKSQGVKCEDCNYTDYLINKKIGGIKNEL